ncbi:MAG: response regulator transcription factor [Chloroflexi bacterium]|nr:response regulator transcription factor [Chloroflexota bacterium]
MTMHVLLIENNDLDQSESLLANLKDQGYQVATSATPEAAIETTKLLWPNLIVFNSIHSLFNLTSFQQALDKMNLNIPYVVVGDRTLSAEVDADTILVAPGKPQQLTQGLKKAASNQKNRFIRLPGLTLDRYKHQLLRHGQAYSLTPKEFKLLYLLVSNPDQILSRKTIMQEVWETDYLGDTRTLDVHIRWIREKIEDNPSRPQRLITIRGTGYRFILNPE